MRDTARRPLRPAAALLALGLLAGACSVEPGTMPGYEPPMALPDAPAPTPRFDVLTDHGVTDDACPDAVNPDNGCIHLGALVDLSGPFAAFGEAARDGAIAFWDHVNEEGGVTFKRNDGIEPHYDVALEEHVRDNAHEVATHLEAFDEIEPDILALALSMGTTMTVEALPEYKKADVLSVPIGWWSGWGFENIVAESGASYCFQAIDGMDWALAQLGDVPQVDHVVLVRGPDRYGDDVQAGVEYWVDPDGSGDGTRAEFEPSQHVVVVEPGGDVTPAVERIAEVRPDVVVLATAPAETAEIATATAERGWDGMLVGMAPSYAPSLLEDDAAANVLQSRFWRVGNVGPLTQGGKAYIDMRRSLGLGEDRDIAADDPAVPANDAWVAGWVSQYPLHEAIKDAIAEGDITRAGVVDALRDNTVKYDGALPWTTFDGVPNTEMTRRTFVSRPDRDAVMGLRLVGDAYVGRTAERRYVTRPCTEG